MDEQRVPVTSQPKPNMEVREVGPPIEPETSQFQAPKKEKKSGKGRKILLVLLFLLLLAGTAYGAYWYGQEQVKKENEAHVADLQKQIDDAKTAANQSLAKVESAEGSYLTIEQWGVKVKSTESAMIYVIENSDSTELAHLSNAKVQSLEGCKLSKASPYNGSVAILSRSKTQTANDAGPSTFITKIDDYNYFVVGSQAPCAASESDKVVESEERTEIIDAAKTVTKAE